MININNKIFLNRRRAAMEVDFNMIPEAIVSHILSHSYGIGDTHIDDIEFDDVLFISDRHINGNNLLLESNDFREAGVTMQRSNFPKRVRTCHATIFDEITDETADMFQDVNLVIIGFVNIIPEHICNNILNFIGNKISVVLFGDSLIDSPEHNNYFMKHLTNASLSIKIDYDNYRLSDKKKINNTLFKLRKDVQNLSDITNSNHVSVTSSNVINIADVTNQLLSNNATVILPKRHYAHVNGLVYQNITSRTKLDFQPGDVFLTKFPWLVEEDGKKYIIPPLVTVRIMLVKNQLFINNHRCFVCDVVVEKDSAAVLIAHNVVIDFTDYILNFDSELFPDNLEDYEDIMKFNQFESHLHDSKILKVMFSKCVSSDMPKYFDSDNTVSYIETIERDSFYHTDFNWYKMFARTKENINIIVTDEFIDVR